MKRQTFGEKSYIYVEKGVKKMQKINSSFVEQKSSCKSVTSQDSQSQDTS